MGPRPNPVSGPVFLLASLSVHLQLAMRFFLGFFAILLRDIMRARSVRAAYLSLLFAVSVYPGAPQTATPKSTAIQDHLQRAQAALHANDVSTAEKEFRAILALDPKNAPAHTNLGVLALGQGDCQTASKEFRLALAAQPSLLRA